MAYEHTTIDKWTGEYDEEYCYSCQKFVEADMDGKCPICEEEVSFGTDEWGSASTAKTYASDAPAVSSDGDIWDRTGSGYTWGKQTTWNQYGGSSMSGMWGSYGGYWQQQDNNAARMLKHKRHLDSLCKVVDPSVHHDLSFAATRTAYTNMGTGQIVIDGTLIKSNDDKLDTVAGLAIHEKLHLVHSQPLVRWEKQYIRDNDLDHWESKLFHSIGNCIEDEYIEKQLAKDCAGFVQYITKTKQYFFDEKIKGMLEENEENPYIDLLNTMLTFIRYPANIDKDRKKRHAKHIQFFARALAKALDSRENVLKAIETLYIYMKKCAELMAKDMPDDQKDKISAKLDELKSKFGDDSVELSPEDWKEIEKKIKRDIAREDGRKGTFNRLMGKRSERERFGNICGATEYNPPEGEEYDRMLPTSLIDEIKDLEQTDYHETALGKSEVVSPRQTKVMWKNAMPDENAINIYKGDSRSMRPQTNVLKRKIDLYGNRTTLTIRNQKRGRIDKRILHRIGIPDGRTDIFKNTITKEDKPLDVCLLVDESGSMGGDRIRNARKACISIMEALKDNDVLNLWVMGHTADGWRWHDEPNATNMTIYHSPKLKDRPFACGSMKARCENRDGNAILAASQKVKEETDNPMGNKLMITFSDGAPAAIGYGGSKGIQHVKKCVNSIESKGWSVIQVGFGGAHFQERMFNNHIYVNDVNNISGKVSKIIRKVIKI
jgi:hypothetical protein